MISMRYDLNADALYLRRLNVPVERTEQIDEGTLVDLSSTGELIGIEVLRPGRNWPLSAVLERYEVPEDDVNLLRVMFPTAGDAAYQGPERQFSSNRLALVS